MIGNSTARWCALSLCATLLLLIGCELPDRVSRLEKENAELKTQIAKDNTVRDFDLAAKCSKDARAWFNENWSREKDTTLLNFTNHYNAKLNKCFILVEYHFNSKLADPPGFSWANDMTLTDVYENAKEAHFSQNHVTNWKPKYNLAEEVIDCDVQGDKCKTIDEFNKLIRPYMSD
jgi:hypothetical protein